MDDRKIPARIAALAAQVGDTPLDWKEREDGSIVIVFCNKGKKTFEPEKPARASAEEPAPVAQVVSNKSQKKGEKK